MIDLAERLWGVRATALAPADLLYIDEQGRRITVGHFAEQAEVWCRDLACAGVGPGELVVCAAQTSPNWLAALAGLWTLGAVPIIGRSSTPRSILDSTARRVGASHVLTVTATGFAADAVDRTGPRPELGTGPGRLLFGQMTSGSSGEPKLVGHNRSGVAAFATSVSVLYQATPDSRILTSADISFGYGFGNTVLIPMLTGAAGVLWSDPAKIEALMATIERESVTIAALSPRVWAGIARRLRTTDGAGPLRTIASAVSAGEPLSDELRGRLEEHLPLPMIDGYGATEVLHIVAARRSAAAGFTPLTGSTLGTATVAADTVLTITGPMVSRLYLHAGPDDLLTLTGDTFVTGDAVRVDDDRLTIVGRADFLINRGGILFSPVELETMAREILGVESVAAHVEVRGARAAKLVLGVADRDSTQTPVQLGKQPRRGLVDAARHHLVPDIVAPLAALPLTDTGKLDRRAAAGMLARRVGSTVRWRDLSAAPGPAIVLLPCAGASADFYRDVAATASCAVSAIEFDLTAVADIDELVDTIGAYLLAETAPGDRIIGHSLGATILAAVAAHRPDAVLDRMTIAFCPPPLDPTTEEFAALTLETDRMLALRFAGQPSALARARRRVETDLSAAGAWLDRLGKHLATFRADVEVSVGDDPLNRGAEPITMCHNHIRIPTGGHYLLLTDPKQALDRITARTPTPDIEEIA